MAAPAFTGTKAWGNYASAGSGQNSTTTNAITTTSGRGLLAIVAGQATGNAPTFSDSKGNTWTKIASLQNSTDAAGMWLCGNPSSVGASHSFTCAWTDNYSSVVVFEIDQAVALDASSTATDAGTPWDSSVTTTVADTLVCMCTAVYATTGSWSLAATGWTWWGQLPDPADASDWDSGFLYKTQATAGAAAISMTGTNVDGGMPHHLIMASLKAAGGSTVSGTMAWTEASDTAALAGSLVLSGTAAWTEANDSASLNGAVTVSGGASWTEANDSAAIAGSLRVSGGPSWTEANDTAAIAGGLTASGAASWTESNDTAALSGTVGNVVAGTVAWTESNDTASIAGSLAVSGAVSWAESSDSWTVNGLVTQPASGAIAWVEDSDSWSIAGSSAATGGTAGGYGGKPQKKRFIGQYVREIPSEKPVEVQEPKPKAKVVLKKVFEAEDEDEIEALMLLL